MQERISEWEAEGGSLNETSEKAMTGTVNQIEWAKQIKTQVSAEFDRVKKAAGFGRRGQEERRVADANLTLERRRSPTNQGSGRLMRI